MYVYLQQNFYIKYKLNVKTLSTNIYSFDYIKNTL